MPLARISEREAVPGADVIRRREDREPRALQPEGELVECPGRVAPGGTVSGRVSCRLPAWVDRASCAAA